MAGPPNQFALRLINSSTESHNQTRFTQDFPIQSNVWLEIASSSQSGGLLDILLTPNARHGVSALSAALGRLGLLDEQRARLGVSESHLVATVTTTELFALLPLSDWWRRCNFDRLSPEFLEQSLAFVRKRGGSIGHALLEAVQSSEAVPDALHDLAKAAAEPMVEQLAQTSTHSRAVAALNAASLVRSILLGAALQHLAEIRPDSLNQSVRTNDVLASELLSTFVNLVGAIVAATKKIEEKHNVFDEFPQGLLWAVAVNRTAHHAVYVGRCTAKADAAVRLFEIDTSNICWAVLDSGIDARHPAFCCDCDALTRPLTDGAFASNRFLADSRVLATYDFTQLRDLSGGRISEAISRKIALMPPGDQERLRADVKSLGRDLLNGRMVDWAVLEPLIEVAHSDDAYVVPVNGHGTHVAGILGANWRKSNYEKNGQPVPGEIQEQDVIGICPEIRFIDLRVFEDDGNANEFALLGALQYLRFRNRSRDTKAIHGVNISLSLMHEVQNYGCGGTPICLEVNRLVSAGIVVVAAAGNFGFEHSNTLQFGGGYRGMTVTDPGNADKAITVGSSHRSSPHAFGVSYFSSRGPTGDGRAKPDLVAPGEKIRSVIPDMRVDERDGTSMAAPHVSGVAALLMARHQELMGDPERIKEILRQSATDLGRERNFQGAGLVDALRALQSV